MNVLDWIILIVLAIWLVLSLRYMSSHKGSCSGCSKNCEGCRNMNSCIKKAKPSESNVFKAK